ncbi:hypothetical protein [Sphaerisporangium sp. TRM90804]|uniref:hypothetical protein n=1 Tax=Sphaerisporangium sp. TRM90804 TaxID=3031113 RepID=UPI00244D5516|nr:hypothetical protein [Sphaerisporangium sp. TRM90804]MDH2426441.1 hypothetical protein [Sphaerisporangium sp. TRM90804]
MSSSTLQAFLAEHGAVRTRVVDDHMFAVDQPGRPPATFRLQLFTAPGLRPVAVATQTVMEGPTLVNAAEEYATEVWRRHCAESAEPPIWIQHQLLPCGRLDHLALVTFTQTGAFNIHTPKWKRVSDLQLAELVGGPVDVDRGVGYRPRPPEPEPQPYYRLMWVARLPRPEPFRQDECMSAGLGWQRLARQLAPRTIVRDCCWYHGGNWHRAAAAVIRLVRRAQRDGVAVEDVHQAVLDAAEGEGMSEWEVDAVASLASLADAIQVTRFAGWRTTSYINGQHRAQAMLEAGVRCTVTVDWKYP